MKRQSKILVSVAVGITLANIAGAASYFVLKREVMQAQAGSALRVGETFSAFSGIDVNGVKWTPRDSPCRVIRVSDDNCSYCKQDQPSYDSILSMAVAASCEVIEMAPKAGTLAYDPRPGVVQIKYVDTDVGEALFPFVTPQTIILDHDWKVWMNRRGMYDEESLADAIMLLAQVSAPPAFR
jgi:hypothetical protein